MGNGFEDFTKLIAYGGRGAKNPLQKHIKQGYTFSIMGKKWRSQSNAEKQPTVDMKDKIIKDFLIKISFLAKNIYEMYLFGSRCRNDWRPDSDYDILIVLKKKNRQIIDKFYDAVMDILLDTGRLISLKIMTTAEFDRLKAIQTPFISNVLDEGIKIGKYH